MKSTIYLAAMLLSLPLTLSCGSFGYLTDSEKKSNLSALMDPRWITLKEGTAYEFQEGALLGRGQVFLSGNEFRRRQIVPIDDLVK